jgi:hypothetical protein
MNKLFGTLGELFNNFPDLRKIEIDKSSHRFILTNSFNIEKFKTYNEIVNSGSLFSFFNTSQIFDSRGTSYYASYCISSLHAAYNDASKSARSIQLLESLFDKLSYINPATISKQLERSLITPKLQTSIDNLIVVEDMGSTVTRDKGRITSLKKSVETLDEVYTHISNIFDLQRAQGFITFFQPVLAQLLSIRAIQVHKFLMKLPTTYLTRVKLFSQFIQKCEDSFELKDSGN